jgi:VanZ family protein
MFNKWMIGTLIVLTYWIFGFYPFNWAFKVYSFNNTQAQLLADGYHFSEPGIAFSDSAPNWMAKAIDNSFLEIDLEVKAANKDQIGPARIFTISKNPARRNLTIGQEGETLVVRMRHPGTNLNGTPSYLVKNVFSSPDWHHIKVSITSDTLTIRVDELLPFISALPEKPFAQWDLNYKMALGNELTFNRPWLGTIRSAVIRVKGENIDYAAPGLLEIPLNYEIIRTFPPVFQNPFFQFNSNKVFDCIINFLGFIPCGLLIPCLNQKRSWLFAASFCLGLSLSIEVGQFLFFPERVPSFIDLALNTLGGMLGVWINKNLLFRFYYRRFGAK